MYLRKSLTKTCESILKTSGLKDEVTLTMTMEKTMSKSRSFLPSVLVIGALSIEAGLVITARDRIQTKNRESILIKTAASQKI